MRNVPETMKALVAYGKGDYKLEMNYPAPECGPDDIIIKTEGCGVCAGDLKCYHGAAMFWGDDVQPSWVEPPFIPGHEFLGHIVELGENVKGFHIGDRKELNVLGSHLSPYCYPFVIENIEKGNLKTEGIVSKTFPIEQWEEAFECATGKYGDFKVAITF